MRILHEVDGWVEGLDWDPTGETLIYAAFEPVAKKNRLHLLSLSNYDTELLAAARPDNAGDYQPRFSPDGRQVAWKGRAPGGGTGLYVADRQGGAVKTVVEGLVPIQGLAWSPDGSSLIYAAAPAGRFNLWQVDLARGETHWVPTPGDFAWNPTVALRSGDLAYEQVRMDQDLWRIRIREREPWELETDRFLASTRWEYEADFHPDGQSIVFVSARSGQPELWRCDAQGENLQQLTFLGPAGIGNPRWSPQGDRIAFNLIQDGKTAIMIVQGQGSDPVPVDFGAGKVSFSSWSGDGQALLVGADRGQGWNIHRLDLADGQTRSLTRDGGLTAMESPSGEFLYYTRPDRPGLWRRSLQNDGGAEDPQRVVADLNHLDRNHWRIIMTDGGRSDLYWVERNAGGAFLLWRDLATEQTSFVTELPGLAGSSLAISPAGDAVLYPRTGSAAGDLMILEHFFPSGK